MSAIGVCLGQAVDNNELARKPKMPHYQERAPTDRYMSPDEELKVFAWLEGKATAEQHDPDGDGSWGYIEALARFLLETGFRFSEAYKFTVTADGTHADLGHGTTKTAGGRRFDGRRVPLTAKAKAAAATLLASPWHAKLKDMVGKSSWDWVTHRWQQATKAAECPDINLHILRHTLASRLVQKGMPIYMVSKWLGHSSVKVTERYAKLAPNSLAEALAALEENPQPPQ
jgi:integrase